MVHGTIGSLSPDKLLVNRAGCKASVEALRLCRKLIPPAYSLERAKESLRVKRPGRIVGPREGHPIR